MAHILVVDDDERLRTLLRLVYEKAGHTVTEAADGNDALRAYTECPADVVVLDIVMPEKEGLETLRELRAMNPDVNVIAVSGGGRIGPEDYLIAAEKLGARYAFPKPIPHDTLLDATEALLAGEPP